MLFKGYSHNVHLPVNTITTVSSTPKFTTLPCSTTAWRR